MKKSNTEKVICVILSGGRSGRMKSPKALLQFSESENFLQHILKVYHQAGIENSIVVIHPDIDLTGINKDSVPFRVIKNTMPERGRLYSLQLGVSSEPDADFCFVQNVDNPFVTPELIKLLLASRSRAEYITPVHKDKSGHPVLISKPVISEIQGLTNYEIPLNELLGAHSRVKVQAEEEGIFRDINTPEDYQRYFGAIL